MTPGGPNTAFQILVIRLSFFRFLHELTQSGSNLKNHNLCDLSFPVVFRAIQAVWTEITQFGLLSSAIYHPGDLVISDTVA
jgi:hypothetical protein